MGVVPIAVTLNDAFWPGLTDGLPDCAMIAGSFTTSVATALVTLPHALLSTNWYCPASPPYTLVSVNSEDWEPVTFPPSFIGTPFLSQPYESGVPPMPDPLK